MRRPIAAVAGMAAGVLALVAAGCGGGGSSSGVQGASHSLTGGKKGGTITILSNGDVDHLDPGAAYYQFTYAITYVTQRPLLAYKPNSIQPTPDLAASMPTVSNGGKTITVHIQHGIKFSPPVNREVTSADVKYAIERGFDAAVGNGYAGAYFGVIKGAPTKIGNTVPNISGIQTPNKYTIVFQLTKPSGIFVGALQEPLTAPVPAEYARKFDKGTSSSYGNHQVATGPYMVQSNAAGKVTGYSPGKQIVLVRNPNWNPKTSWRPAYADKIVFREGFDPTVGTKQILNGQADANGDFPPPAANLKQILSNSSQKSQLEFTPTAGARFVALNTQKPPFNNKYVRMAVAYVLDRNAMRLTRGGAIDGKIATHFIDPSFGSSGFNQAGGYGFNPFPSPNNSGDVAKARGDAEEGGLQERQVQRAADHAGRGQHASGLEHGGGRCEQPAEDRLQREDDLRPARCDVHALLRRAEERAEHLPERRVDRGLPRAAGRPRRQLRRHEHPAGEQRQLVAVQRPDHQQADGEGEARSQRREALAGVGPDRQADHLVRSGGPVAVGGLADALLDPGDARDRALERWRAGRVVHVGEVRT